MSFFAKRDLGDTANQLIPPRSRGVGAIVVNQDVALRHSAVWACLRLRADVISTMPLDTYRSVGDIDVSVPNSPFLQDPGGDGRGTADWLYASQFDLDRGGNAFGIIRARDALGFPAVVELLPYGSVTIKGHGPSITGFRVMGRDYDAKDIWHERQFVVAGVPLGLSPIAYAAWSIGSYLSAQQFSNDWFGAGAIPVGTLRNSAKTLTPNEAQTAKDRYKTAVANRDVFVTGSDWEFKAEQITAGESQFLETQQYGLGDIARFLGVPGDMIDAATTKGTVTYANITQRNLQLLIMNLGPAIIRRERALSQATPKPRFVKLNTDALLRMDPATRATMQVAQVAGRILAPSEAREQNNLPPFTSSQIAEFEAVGLNAAPAPAAAPAAQPDPTGVPA